MFDFEKLDVYKKAKNFNGNISHFLNDKKIEICYRDQLRRAAFSIILNIAEGSGRFTKPDKRNFYVIARGSVFECVAVLDYLKDMSMISNEEFDVHYSKLEELSKMLYSLIQSSK